MAWLMRGTEVLASLEVADRFWSRARGLLGRSGIEGALLIRPASSVHSIGMRFAIDVAFCNADLVVIRIVKLRRYRATRYVRRAKLVIEAEAGAFERWNLQAGDQLGVL